MVAYSGTPECLKCHGVDLHEAVVHNSSVSRASGRHTLSSVKPAPSVGCRCAGSAVLALDRVRVQLHCRMWRHLVQCATSRPEDIIVHDCRRRKRLWINNHHSASSALTSSNLHRYVLQGTQPARRASGVCKVSVKYTDSRTAAAKTQDAEPIA